MGSLRDAIRQSDPQRRFCSTLQTWEWNVSCQHGKTTFGCSWLDISRFPWKDFKIFSLFGHFWKMAFSAYGTGFYGDFIVSENHQKCSCCLVASLSKCFFKTLWLQLNVREKGAQLTNLFLCHWLMWIIVQSMWNSTVFDGVLVWVVVWLPTSETNPRV